MSRRLPTVDHTAPEHAAPEHAAPERPALARSTLRVAAAGAVRVYQLLASPWLPPSCRFTPTCSEYARQSLLKHGIVRGAWLALRRLSRCHPLGSGGYDPVP